MSKKRKVGFSLITLIFLITGVVLVFLILSSKSRKYTNVDIEFIKLKIENGNSVVVLYGQELCGSCKLMKEKLKEATSESNINLYYLASEDVSDYAFLNAYGITVVPSILIIKNHTLIVYEGDLATEEIFKILGEFP